MSRKALLGGAVHDGPNLRWDISGGCESPITIVFRGRYILATRKGDPRTMEVICETPCRTCPRCHRRRRSTWAHRASTELTQAKRTWLGTLTVRPEDRYRAALLAEQEARRRGHNWETATELQRFQWQHAVYSKEITRFLKRVRTNSEAPLRFLSVCERHRDGAHHYHMLLHETSSEHVTHAVLTDAWHLGFTRWKLVDELNPKAALYVVKYLSKDAQARVRASVHYGEPRREARSETTSADNEPKEAQQEHRALFFGECENPSSKTRSTEKESHGVIGAELGEGSGGIPSRLPKAGAGV